MALHLKPVVGSGSAAALIDRMGGLPVLVVGDVMLDRFIYGRVERVSPEAPIPVLKIGREVEMLGGAGNVARNVAAAGGRALLCGLIGGDDTRADAAGQALTALARDNGDITPLLVRQPGRPTTVKSRYVAGGQHLLRSDAEALGPPDPPVREALMKAARSALPEARVLVLSDYAKGVLDPDGIAALIAAAGEVRVPVVVDPKRADLSACRGATVIKPNRAELAAAVGRPCRTAAEVEDAARELLSRTGAQAIVATLGPEGLTIVTPDRAAVRLPTLAREVFDVSGAGDTVAALLALGLAARADIVEAAEIANLAGGLVVGKVGTATAARHDLLDAVHGVGRGGDAAAKLADRMEAAHRAESWRARGLRIGFTNGCFDLLHPGHIALLAQARRLCDRLIVGINDDASVGRLKGAGRPLQSAAARAAILASLADVDLVTIFPEDTPGKLIETVAPDVLIKGADYAQGEIVGAEFVTARGGQVVRAELIAGQATSNLVARIRQTGLS